MRADFLRISLSMALLLSSGLGLRGQDMIITGVIDGPLTGGLPKAIELYVVNNIPDLSIYGLGSPNNGAAGGIIEFTFPAVPATAGDFLYVATEQVEFNNFFGFTPDYTDGVANINGDDALELFLNNTVIDVFGVVGTDGSGEPWEYTNGWAYRSDGTGPSTTFTNGDWSYSGPNALNGAATNATATPSFPLGSYQPSLMLSVSTGTPAQTTACVTPVDASAAFAVPFTVSNGTFNAGNTFTAEISDDGFVSSVPIGTLAGTGSGSITATVPAGTAAGTYQLRVLADDPATTGSVAPTSLSVIDAPAAITGFSAFAGNGEINLTWANPANCFDDVVILAQEGAPVNADFSQANLTGLADETDLATANADWATRSDANDAHDQLLTLLGADDATYTVYNGNGNTVTITGLTNGTTYHFRVLTEFGTQRWSVAADASATPSTAANLPTVLRPGDMAIVGFSDQVLGGGSEDGLSFVNFVPLNPGTEILLTDNGYETDAAAGVRTDLWNNDEGVISLTWNGPGALPAGTVTEYQTGITPTGWTLSCVADRDGVANTCTTTDFNFSTNGDQVFIMQGNWDEGSYTCGAGTEPCEDATFTGRIIYGFNGIDPGWISLAQAPSAVDGNASRLSRLPPEIRCFNAEYTTIVGEATYELTTDPTPPPHVADQRVLLNAVKDLSNWKTTYEVTDGFTVQPGGFEAGLWYGSADDNWFDCNNWGSLQVPNDTTDVRLDPATSAEPIVVAENAAFSDEFGDTAVCRDLFIGFEEVEVANLNDRLVVRGDLTIIDGFNLILDGGGLNGGTLQVGGDWDNQTQGTGGFQPGVASNVIFDGSAPQTLIRGDGSLRETFANLALANPAGLTIQSPVQVNANLGFGVGILATESGGLLADSLHDAELACLILADGATVAGASDLSHVDGVVEWRGDDAALLPLGDGTQLHRAELGASSDPNDVFRAEYFQIDPTVLIGPNTTVNVDLPSEVEYWWISRVAGTGTRPVALQYQNPLSAIQDPNDAYVIRYDTVANTWEQAGGNGNVAVDQALSLIRSQGLATFSPFTFAQLDATLPVEGLAFTATPQAQAVRLRWTTEREVNVSHFVVERSAAGRSFAAIGQRGARGAGRYALLDEQPLPGRSYYRLRMVDLDGTVRYSDRVAVSLGRVVAPAVVLFPQPAGEQATLQWQQAEAGLATWYLIDQQGRRVRRWQQRAAAGTTTLSLDLHALPAGVYQLQGVAGGRPLVARLMKE